MRMFCVQELAGGKGQVLLSPHGMVMSAPLPFEKARDLCDRMNGGAHPPLPWYKAPYESSAVDFYPYLSRLAVLYYRFRSTLSYAKSVVAGRGGHERATNSQGDQAISR